MNFIFFIGIRWNWTKMEEQIFTLDDIINLKKNIIKQLGNQKIKKKIIKCIRDILCFKYYLLSLIEVLTMHMTRHRTTIIFEGGYQTIITKSEYYKL